jgi:ferredoxin-nitrite reductase
MSAQLSFPTLGQSTSSFSTEQKEYLDGMMAGLAQRKLYPFAHQLPQATATTATAAEEKEETFHGFPISDLCKQELWKHAKHGLDGWERLMEHSRAGTMPGEEDSFRFRFFGLFNVSPTQESLMLRCRIPAGEMSAYQLRGMAAIAEEFGDGGCAVTTRSNLQVRGIHPQHSIAVLVRLQGLGLTARGSGVDNVRNITASPTAGVDPQEIIDMRPYAHDIHHYILNHRDMYDLPRKFNVAFDGGGLIDTVADTNDIGFMAVTVPTTVSGKSLRDGSALKVEAGVWFRVELAGITGHKQLATDSGILIRPEHSTALSAAMLRVFSDHGDRTDRKKARLKYLIDSWGVPKFLAEVQQRLDFDLIQLPADQSVPRPAAVKHAHLGVHPQKQAGLNYVGVVVPVGMLTAVEMRSIAKLCEQYGSGMLRLTPWQNLILTDVKDADLPALQQGLKEAGLSHEASHAMGGLIACTGSRGCKYASADTKGNAITIGKWLDAKITLPQPVNIHLTGCPHSCAQHYVGDIGLQAVKVDRGGQSVDGYNVVIGGGTGAESGIGRALKNGVAATEAPELIEKVLSHWISTRQADESFHVYANRLSATELESLC